MSLYRKAIVAVAGAVLMLLPAVLSDDRISNVEWVQVAIAAATAYGVWLTANVSTATRAKAAIAGVLAGLNLLVTYLATGGHITGSMWANLLIAVVVAAGVLAVPNATAGAHRLPV